MQTLAVQFENNPAPFDTIPPATIAPSLSGRAQLSVDTPSIPVAGVINHLSVSLKLTAVYVECPHRIDHGATR